MLGNMRRQKISPHVKCSNPVGSSSVAAAATQEQRAIGGQAPDARHREIAAQPSHVPETRAHSGRHRKQEFVIFASAKGIAQRRPFFEGQRVSLDDRAETAGLGDLPYPVSQAVAQVYACAGRAVAAEHQTETCPRLRPQVAHHTAVGNSPSRLCPTAAEAFAGQRRHRRARR